uniref:PpiC n=1 Tax=Vibrio cholerae TaxID=666 RepID=K7SEN9_VIBCL|nr:ppiC [Vibrio cholerae]
MTVSDQVCAFLDQKTLAQRSWVDVRLWLVVCQ